MGLDGVELVMALEDGFQIRINDSEAARCVTPRTVIDLIFEKVRHRQWRSRCQSRQQFHLIRRTLLSETRSARMAVHPAMDLTAALSAAERRRVWQSLETNFSFKLPNLMRPAWCRWALGIGSLAIWPLMPEYIPFEIKPALVLVAFLVGVKLTRPLKNRFPKNLNTVGDLVQTLSAESSASFQPTGVGWKREEVAAEVNAIIVAQLGIKPGSFSEDSRFVEDLGLD